MLNTVFMTSSTPLCSIIGRTIAHRRETIGLTQDGLARLLRATGVQWTGVTVAKVEAGTRDIRAGELVALGMALGLSPPELLESREPTRLARSAAWVPGDAITSWARGEEPSVHQRAQWARDADSDAAPVRLLDDRARQLAAYLSHQSARQPPTKVSMREVREQMAAVTHEVEEWVGDRARQGRPPSAAARRAKERRAWAARRRRHPPDGPDIT